MVGRAREAGLAAVLAAAALGLAGCGMDPAPAPATVRGTVTFQGRPLAGGLIVFAPDRERGNGGPAASAAIGPDGSFVLSTAGSPAVAPGWYRVALADPPGVFHEGAGLPRFPAVLRRPDRSGLAREVVAGQDNVFIFEVEVTNPSQ